MKKILIILLVLCSCSDFKSLNETKKYHMLEPYKDVCTDIYNGYCGINFRNCESGNDYLCLTNVKLDGELNHEK